MLYRLAQIYGLSVEILLITEPHQILQNASSHLIFEKGERELIHLYRRLSSFSRGRLLEKAEDLLVWESAFGKK